MEKYDRNSPITLVKIDRNKLLKVSYDIKIILIGDRMNPCEFSAMITSIACIIAKDKCPDELELIGATLSQLGDTLTTMSTYENLCCEPRSECKKDES